MEHITLELLLYLAAGAALGGYVNGLAGFGTGLMSLGIWLQVMTVEQAVPVVAAMSVASGVQSLWLTRQGVKTGLHRHAVEASPLSSFAQNPSLFPLRNLVISEINSSIKESETYISEVAVIKGEEHTTASSITSSSCHIFLKIILSFIMKPLILTMA